MKKTHIFGVGPRSRTNAPFLMAKCYTAGTDPREEPVTRPEGGEKGGVSPLRQPMPMQAANKAMPMPVENVVI